MGRESARSGSAESISDAFWDAFPPSAEAASRNFDGAGIPERSRLGVSDAPNFGPRGGNSSHAKSRAKDSDFLSVGGISMLCLLALLYLLESYALLACFALPTRIPCCPEKLRPTTDHSEIEAWSARCAQLRATRRQLFPRQIAS